jgi:hypothetical protein
MGNDEIQMTNDERNPNDETQKSEVDDGWPGQLRRRAEINCPGERPA